MYTLCTRTHTIIYTQPRTYTHTHTHKPPSHTHTYIYIYTHTICRKLSALPLEDRNDALERMAAALENGKAAIEKVFRYIYYIDTYTIPCTYVYFIDAYTVYGHILGAGKPATPEAYTHLHEPYTYTYASTLYIHTCIPHINTHAICLYVCARIYYHTK